MTEHERLARLSERCECLHQKRQHAADADFDGESWTGWHGPCEVSNCPCRKFTEMEESE